MLTPEGIIIARIMPDEARHYTTPILHFLEHAYDVTYRQELGLPLENPADPSDSWNHTMKQRAIEWSGDLGSINESAFIVAQDARRNQYAGIVGHVEFNRIDDDDIIVRDLFVAPELRGRRIGPYLLDFALSTLDIDERDTLTLLVPDVNEQAARFFASLGGVPQNVSDDMSELFPGTNVIGREYTVARPLFAAQIQARLQKPHTSH